MTRQSDILVIGSGIAGLIFSLQAAEYATVTIITKKKENESNTNYAQGGIATVIDKTDSFDEHIRDTHTAGAGLCHDDTVRFMVEQGPQAIKALVAIGVEFSRLKSGDFELGREGGHSKNRIVHAADLTGREIETALIAKVKKHRNITLLENHVAIDLITEHQTTVPDYSLGIHCWGAYALDIRKNKIITFLAKITLLSTGGCGRVYQHTSNPEIASGDGLAMAYRAGARIANLEFMQFHPTILYHRNSKSFLISEAVRGFGAKLRNRKGEAFMADKHELKDLAPRDIVARAIDAELKRSGEPCVYLDLTAKSADKIKERFPNIYNYCLNLKLDITSEWIPVVPAAHYMCGGVVVDTKGHTTVDRLLACGEVSFTGVHGANRLASNSLLEAVVFASTAAQSVKELMAKSITYPEIKEWDEKGTLNSEEWVYLVHDRNVIRSVMWDYVGIVRSTFRLQRAWRRLEMITAEVEEFYKKTSVSSELIELRNIATVSKLIVQSALSRKESRGLHYTTDFPQTDDRFWKHDTVILNQEL